MDGQFSLAGKTILITGASSGIGRVAAISFAKSGAKLILNGRNEKRLVEVAAECPDSVFVVADLSSTEGVMQLVSKLPQLDGVFLCAGISFQKLIKFSDDVDLEKIFNTNCFSAMRTARELAKSKKLKKGGSVVIVASVAGLLSSIGHFLYGSSKAALIGFGRALAVEFAARQIRVNTISPGMVDTPMTRDFISGETELAEVDKRKYLLGYGTPDDVANAAQYLLSDASRWVTGSNLVVDGGFSCQK